MDKNLENKILENFKKTRVTNKSISNELENSFLEYAVSVIVSRALPDVRDGFKPVHRRILYAAYQLGITHDKPYKKSARLVGEIIGKYHPHGDSAVYDTMVRLAQNFSMRYPLIDGHGNFGSIDGDSPAAMRYTEVRLSKISSEILNSIEKETVNFVDNYDSSEKEPSILPGLFPNLLANGSSGIAVGMATNIPPHNLKELVNALLFVINNENASFADIKQFLKGPDFPTAGQILNTEGILDYYKTGKGSIIVRATAEIEKNRETTRIIIKELPYMVNKISLIEKIVDLVKSNVIEGISDLRDETSRKGIRIVIDVKKGYFPEVLLNKLYKTTPLQISFGVNMVALVDKQPKIFNIKEILNEYLKHQFNVLINKTNFELKKTQKRLHILEGLNIALSNIDNIISLIKNSVTNKEAKELLIKKYNLTDKQAEAILEMRLRFLSSLEKQKIEKEIAELTEIVIRLTKILDDKNEQIKIICDLLKVLKEKYGDERKSKILYGISANIHEEDLIPNEQIVISKSNNNYLKRVILNVYKIQNRGGIGVKGVNTYTDDEANELIIAWNHSDILLFTNLGKVYRIKAYKIPIGSRISKGIPAINLVGIEKNEKIVTMLSVDDYLQSFLFFATEKGIVKKTNLSEFNNINSNGKKAIIFQEDDKLLKVFLTRGKDEIYLSASNGLLAKFNEEDVRPTGRNSRGIKGIKLEERKIGKRNNSKVKLVGASSSYSGDLILSISEKGFGKLSAVENYRLTRRGSKGVLTLKQSEKTGRLIFSSAVKGNEEILILTSSGKIIRLLLAKLRILSRVTSGVTLIKLLQKEKITSVITFDSQIFEN